MGDQNFMGGLLGGLSQSLQKQQEVQMLKSYRDAQVNHLKKQTAAEEAKLDKELAEFQMKKPFYEAAAAELNSQLGGGAPGPPPVAAAPQPQAPQAAPPMWGPGSLPRQMAQGQLNSPMSPTGGQAPPVGQGGIQIPGDPANNISVRQNNPFNVKHVGQEGSQGAGTRGFAIFDTPEAGIQAGIKQIQLDQSRGLPYAKFAEKYAPAYENPTWKADVAKLLGGIPDDMPINQIPTLKLAQAIGQRESSLPPQYVAQVYQGGGQPQGMATPPVLPGRPRTPMITPAKVLAGILKKEFGVEPDDAKVVAYGDHKLVTDKAGNPQFIIAGQGKMEMVDVTAPDGRVIRQPQLIPPSPLPGGIPVYNMAGQPATDVAGPQGVQTAPPEVTYTKQQQPDGSVAMMPTPKAQMGGAGYITELSPLELPKILPDSVKSKIGENNSLVDQLNVLQATFDPSYVGYEGLAGKASDALSGMPGAPALGLGDPRRAAWNQIYNEMLGQKLHQRGGSALTKQEIAYIMATLPSLRHNADLFKAGVEAAKLLLQASNYEMMAAHLTPDKAKYEKAAAKLIGQYQSKFKPMMEKGLKAGPPPPMVKNPLPQGATGPIQPGDGLSPAGQKYLQQRGF